MMQESPSSIYTLTGLYFASLEGRVPDLSLKIPPTRLKSSAPAPSPANLQSTMDSLAASVYLRASTISDLEKHTEVMETWKPDKAEYMVMLTMAVISLVVALDSTILVTSLPVCLFNQANAP